MVSAALRETFTAESCQAAKERMTTVLERLAGAVPKVAQLLEGAEELLRALDRGGVARPALQASLPWRPACHNRVDGLYRSERVIIECDGRRWHSRMEAMAEDRRRDREAQLHGYNVFRFVWEDITKDAPMVCATVRRALESGA